jgi:uncharacterized protein YoxC
MVNRFAAGRRATIESAATPVKRSRLVKQLIVAGLAALVVLVGAACGGSGNDSTTTDAAAATQDWANGICTATNTYVKSLTSLGDTLQGGNLSKDSLDSALDKAKSATQTFSDDLKDVGSPPVSDSQTKQVLDGLRDDLSKDADTIKSALSNISNVSEALSAVSTVTGTLATVGTTISSAYTQIKQIDPKGTVQSAFQNAPACSSLTGS